jgi:hypothetical protein
LQDPSKFTQIGIIGKRLEDYLGGEKYIWSLQLLIGIRK